MSSSEKYTCRDQYGKGFNKFVQDCNKLGSWWKCHLVEYILVENSTEKVLIRLYKTATNLVNYKKLLVLTGSLQDFKNIQCKNIIVFYSC